MEVVGNPSPVKKILRCTPEEFERAKVNEYATGAISGSTWLIQSKNESDLTIEVVLCVTEQFTLGPRR